MKYDRTQRLAQNCGPQKRSGQIIMTNEARVIRDCRIEIGLSMREAAKLLGYSDSYISHIENGRTNTPKEVRAEKFLEVYGNIKLGKFYERVRRCEDQFSATAELGELVPRLPEE